MSDQKVTYTPGMERLQLTQASSVLSDLYRLRSSLKLRLENNDVSISFRLADLTPEDGWPGKNVTERKQAEEDAKTEDRELMALQSQKFVFTAELISVNGEIDALLVDIKRIRWNTLSRMAEALYRNPAEIGTIVEEALEEPTEFTPVYAVDPGDLTTEEATKAEMTNYHEPGEPEDVPF